MQALCNDAASRRGIGRPCLQSLLGRRRGRRGPGERSRLIVAVEAQTLLKLKSLDLTDEAGKTWHFDAKGKIFASFTPSHLNGHMLQGLRVTVVFHRDGETLVVDDITD